MQIDYSQTTPLLILCPYCGRLTEFMTSEEFYGRDYGTNMYVCRPCDARIATFGTSVYPRGVIANAPLRVLRQEAHKYLDTLWQEGTLSRRKVYEWLDRFMKMGKDEAHIAYFDEEQCTKLIRYLQFEYTELC